MHFYWVQCSCCKVITQVSKDYESVCNSWNTRAPVDAPQVESELVSVQEAWEAAGGNPGIKATKAQLLLALKSMDEAIDSLQSRTALTPAEIQPYAQSMAESAKILLGVEKSMDERSRRLIEQQASVTVLPERSEGSRNVDDAWNAAIDKTEKLNAKPVTIELLRRVCGPDITIKQRGDVYDAITELRELIK